MARRSQRFSRGRSSRRFTSYRPARRRRRSSGGGSILRDIMKPSNLIMIAASIGGYMLLKDQAKK